MPNQNTPSEPDTRLLDVLASLNQISVTINRLGAGDTDAVESTLQMIADSAVKVVPGSSAVIYSYDQRRGMFDAGSRVSAGEWISPITGDNPRADGLGTRAVTQRRRVLSYEESDLRINPLIAAAGALSVVCFPLVVADQAVGALYIYLHEVRSFSQLELLMLENFVNQAAMAIYQAQRLADARRDLARKEDELNRLRRAGLLISSRLSLDETLESILQMALEVTNAHYGIFRLVDTSGEKLVTHAVAGDLLQSPMVETLSIEGAASVTGWVARMRQPACIPDLQEEPWSSMYYPLDADLQMRSELAVPLISAGGRLEGVINLESPQVGAFSEADSHLLQSLATQAVIAIQEVRLLDALQEVAQLLLKRSYREVIRHLAELASDLLDANTSSIWIRKGEQLILEAVNGRARRSAVLPLHDSLTGQAILKRIPVTSENVRADPRFNQTELALEQGWERALIVPMIAGSDDEPVGAFSVYSVGSDSGHFVESEWDKKVLTCLAQYAALAVQNAARQSELRAMQEQHAVTETFAAVGDIAANVMHHLNNKVGTIPVRIQGIQDKCAAALAEDRYLAANLAEIERSACEAMETVRDNLSQLRPIKLAQVSVLAVTQEALRGANLPESITVTLQGLDDLPPVVAGEKSLGLVFSNLLGNAAEAMPGGGNITLRGESGNEWVHVIISDSGPGIPPELHERIFELDFSGRAAQQNGKLGFGLWWVKTLMSRLGGNVSVESDGLHGTTFHLKLPKAKMSGNDNPMLFGRRGKR